MKVKMKQIRVGLGLGQREVADKAGMPIRRYGSYERGERSISLEDAARIADVFDCSLDELAGRWEYVGRYADERQRRLNSEYQALDETGKDAAVAAISGMAAASKQGQDDSGNAEAGARRAG